MHVLKFDDPIAVSLVEAIRSGDIASLTRQLQPDGQLADVRIEDRRGTRRSLLHVATDWPGYFPQGPAVVRLLIEAGADPNAPLVGGNVPETPLHWAASSDDADVAAALIDGGADLEVGGASIAGGPPLDDAVGYGCWNVARLLVERGAHVRQLWHAAALGHMAVVESCLAADPPPSRTEISNAFWQACHGGQRRTAERLFLAGADVNWLPDWATDTPVVIAASGGTQRDNLVEWLRQNGATQSWGEVKE